MSLTVSSELILATKTEHLEPYRARGTARYGDREIMIDQSIMSDACLEDLLAAARYVKDTKTARAVEAIQKARTGIFSQPVPNFKAFSQILSLYLKQDRIRGWVFVREADGKLYPELVTNIRFDPGNSTRNQHPYVYILTESYGCSDRGTHAVARVSRSHSFGPQSVSRKRVEDILAAAGIFKETPDLLKEYDESLSRHAELIREGFSRQFRIDGAVYKFDERGSDRPGQALSGNRVIHDLASSDYGPVPQFAESCLFEDDSVDGGVGPVPEHPLVRVFDLRSQEFYWVHSDSMEQYEYDTSLRDKLVLPQSHRDLLDVLTQDLSAFVGDFIEGKSAGNVILCKGIPGVGKTLTAEVYAELIGRPLYSIRTGTLGTDAETIEANLQTVFMRSKRWNCVLLLDEADVFVVQRGNSIEQNAIVAEFLRTLEYFDGLLFMTTNRPDDIDEAIVSRCAAIIDYAPPPPEDAASIWRVIATQNRVTLGDELVQQLVENFPHIAPRDIKMLFRLAMRVAASKNEQPNLDTFRRCAMFRAIKMRQ